MYYVKVHILEKGVKANHVLRHLLLHNIHYQTIRDEN